MNLGPRRPDWSRTGHLSILERAQALAWRRGVKRGYWSLARVGTHQPVAATGPTKPAKPQLIPDKPALPAPPGCLPDDDMITSGKYYIVEN